MCGLDSFESARVCLHVLELVYRLMAFTDANPTSIRGNCPLELAGYDLEALPIARLFINLQTSTAGFAFPEGCPNSTISLATPPDRTLGDVLKELFGLLFRRPRRVNLSAGFQQLTPREREIAYLAAQGHTNKEIADERVIAPDSVKTHMHNTL